MSDPRWVQVERVADRVLKVVTQMMPKGLGFAVIVFEAGAEGRMTWISNAEKRSMAKALRGLADRLEGVDN